MGGKRIISLIFFSLSLLLLNCFIIAADAQLSGAPPQDVFMKKIIYILEDGRGLYQIAIMDLNGENKKTCTNAGNNWAPTVSPSGEKIAFYSDRSGFANLWIMNTDGSKQEQMSFNKENIHAIDLYNRGQIDWAKDGKTLFYLKNNDIWEVDDDGETPSSLSIFHDVTSFKLSPDREKILFSREKTKRHNGLWIIHTNGTQLKQITPSNIISPAFDWGDNLEVAYSFFRGISRIEYNGVNDRFIKQTFYPENDIGWSKANNDRKANFIACILDESGAPNVWITKPDGAESQQITFNRGFSPCWTPDGKELVYVEGSDMYITTIATKDKRRLTYNFSVYFPVVADIKVSPTAAK